MTLKAYFACYPCLLRQTIEAVNFLQLGDISTKEILQDSMNILIDMDENLTSAEIAALIHQNIIKKVGGADPYAEAKKESLQRASAIYAYAKEIIANSNDPLSTAIKICTAGNVIDFGPTAHYDLKATIQDVLERPFSRFDYDAFKIALDKAEKILFLADNAGETLFDKLLIEEINKPLYYVVKKNPIMNDALEEDAMNTGFPEYVQIMDNGTAIQGTVLKHCSKEFIEKYNKADMIISKGMGNFETLPEEGVRAFFLLKVKCKPIAELSGIPENSFVLKQGGLLLS